MKTDIEELLLLEETVDEKLEFVGSSTEYRKIETYFRIWCSDISEVQFLATKMRVQTLICGMVSVAGRKIQSQLP